MSKKTTKPNQKKDSQPVVLLPFSQQYNSQDSLFNENEAPYNSQYANNIFNKPLSRDNFQFASGGTSNKLLNIPHSIFENEWENNQNDIPITKQSRNQSNRIVDDRQNNNQIDQQKSQIEQMELEEEGSEEEDMFEPEYLIDKRVINGQVEYLVKWIEFSVEESTWEQAENVQVCAFDLIQQFEDSLKQGGNKGKPQGNKSPIQTPTHRKQMPSPNLSRNNNLSQLQSLNSNRSPMRKKQATPQTKSGIKQQESIRTTPIVKGSASPLIPYSANRKNQDQSTTTLDKSLVNQEKQNTLKNIQNETNSRVFDRQFESYETKIDPKNNNKNYNVTPKNEKKTPQISQDPNVRQVFNAEGEIIFEQKKIVDQEDKYYNKNKSPLLKLVKDSNYYTRIQEQGNNYKSPIATPNKQSNQAIYHTPVNQKTIGDKVTANTKSPITGTITPSQNQKYQLVNKSPLPQNNNKNFDEEKNQQLATPTNKGRGRQAQNKQLEVPPSPIMTPTIDMNNKSPNYKINRKNIYKDIEVSHDLLKSPIGKTTPMTNLEKNTSLIPQSPPMIFDEKGIKKSGGKRKKLLKRIEISDEDDSDIENIEYLEAHKQIVDDIVPAFAEQQKVGRSKNVALNQRSANISTSITPTKQQGNVTPNNKNIKTPLQNKLDQTPVNKLKDLTPLRDVLRNQSNNSDEEIQENKTPTRSTRQNLSTTPINKPAMTSIWSYKKNNNQTNQKAVTPVKKIDQQNSKTPTKSNNKSPLNKIDPKSPIKKKDLKSPISKTMEVEEGSKRKRRRQNTFTSDDEPTPIRQDKTPTRQNLTPIRQDQTPIRQDQTPSRRSNRNRDEKSDSVIEKELEKRNDDIQNIKESYQTHMKLRENRVQLQTQQEQISSVLQSTKENLNTLKQLKFNIQKEEQEDLYTRVKKKLENIIKQQAIDSSTNNNNQNNKNTKSSNYETPKKNNINNIEKITPESKSKNSKLNSIKKNQKIDPKANMKKNNSKSATKDTSNMDIENEIQLEQTKPLQPQPPKNLEQPVKDKSEKSNKESQSSQKGDKESLGEQATPNSKNRKSKNKKEDKIEQKNKEKQEKLNNQIEHITQDQEIEESHKEQPVTPVTENKRSTRTSSRLSSIKQDKTPTKEEKQELESKNNQITTRRGQINQKDKDQEIVSNQDFLKTPEKQKSNSKQQKVDPKGRSTRSSIKNNQKEQPNLSADNTPIKEVPKEQLDRKENSQDEARKKIINKNENTEKEDNIKQDSQKIQNISRILNLISQKKQKRGSRNSKNIVEYPQFEIELSNGKQEIINYSELVESHPKMIADFLIKDYIN